MQAVQQAQMQAQQQQHDMLMQQNIAGAGGRLRLAPGGPPLPMMGADGLSIGSRLLNVRAALGNGGRLGARELASATAAARAASVAAEPEGPPPLDEADLAVLISLLRTSLPLSKLHLQKLFLNLAAHSTSREQLLQMMLSLLRGLPGTSADGVEAGSGPEEASDSMQTGTSGRAAGMDISEDGSSQQQPQQQQQQQGLSAALDRLGAAEPAADAAAASVAAGASAAEPQQGLSSSPQGKPAVVSRRVLDMLSYLSRHSTRVSRKMLSLRVPDPNQQALIEADAKGKGKMVVDEAAAAALSPRAVEVLLAMLSAPLCQRSVGLLEQLMVLMEVVLTMVQRHEADLAALAAFEEAQEQQREAEAERTRQREQQQREREQQAQQQQQPAAAASQPEQQEVLGQAAGAAPPAQQQQQQQPAQPPADADKQQQEATQPKQKQKQPPPPPSELAVTFASIRPKLLRQLPGLLAREVLSEPAYASIAKVIKLIVESAPAHLPLMLSELVEGAAGVADALLSYLDTAAQRGIDADAQLAPAIGTKSSVVLRMLYALQGFQTELQERVKQQKEQQQKEQQQKEQEAGAAEGAAGAGGAAAGSSSGAGGSSSGAAAAGPSSSAAAAAAGASSSSAAAASSAVQPLDAAAAAAEVDKAVSAVAARTAPLWKSLSSCILRIEDNLRAVLPQHTQAGGESAGNAAARLLPPGAQQVLPLVEAFFVLCALQGAIPAAPTAAKDLLSAPSMDLNTLLPGAAAAGTPAAAGGPGAAGTSSAAAAAAASGGGAGASGLASAGSLWRPGSIGLGDAGSGTPADVTLPFLKFAERHRRLLNAYIRRNTSLLESSLAPLLRVPKLIDFDNKRAYFRCVGGVCLWGDRGVLKDMHMCMALYGARDACLCCVCVSCRQAAQGVLLAAEHCALKQHLQLVCLDS
jgi:hypothetical protein